MNTSVLKILLAVFLIGGCVRQVRQADVAEEIVPEPEFLYMEEVYAYASSSFKGGDIDGAYGWYERLDSDYPDNPYMAESLFIRGYILKTYLDDPENAEVLLKKIIEKFPDSDFFNPAVFELKHLDNPGFIPEFEKQRIDK